jgi:hypothetical protein
MTSLLRGSVARMLLALSLLTGVVGSARAAETGTVSGTVFNPSGEPVADAEVTIVGPLLPDGRMIATGPNGWYRFEYVLPGEYTVEISGAGPATIRRAVIVEVGKDTQADLVVGLTVSEQLTVTAARPIVDVRSVEVSFNLQAETFNALPIDRTYRGLFQLIPGVADNRSQVGPAAGGNRQDNTYLMDGTNITNPGFGYLSTEVSELDIAEINVKRAAISAEFGRTGGTVTNAVSRSGSNQLAGIGRIDWLSKDLVGANALPRELLDRGVRPGAFRDPRLTTEAGPGLGVGGPILVNRIFFYGSARYSRETKWGRVNKVGTRLPDEVRVGQEVYGKLTAVPTARHQVNAGYRFRPSAVEHAALDSNAAPGVATNTDNGSRIASADWTHFISGHSSLNVRYLFMKENNEDTPVSDLGYLPLFDPAHLGAMGQYNDPAQADLKVGGNQYTNIQNYRRHEARAVFSRFMDIRRTSHVLKAGGGWEFAEETLNRLTNGWGLLQNVTQNGVPALRARYYTRQPSQLGRGTTYSVFGQDEITIANRATIALGVLLTRDEFSQELKGSRGCPSTVLFKGGAALYESRGDRCNFLRFGFGDEVQPRLGASVQVRKGKSDKAYANWGRYYNMDQKSAGRSLAPNRLFQTQTFFDMSGAVLSSGPLASTTGKWIDPAIRPTYSDEVVFGYATPFAGAYGVDVFFMSRSMKNMIEDLPSRLSGTAPDSGPFVAANLPCAAFAACRSADARRTYRALTADVRRRLLNGWTSDISYTWSRFEGNYDLDYSLTSVFNTSSFIQDGPGTNVEDPNRFGPLFEDRPHVFKLFTSVVATSRVMVSGYLRVQSGTPWAARGRDVPGAVMNYLEPAGSHRNPVWTNLDVMGSYRVPLAGRASVSLEARLLNVFNNQTRLSTDSQQFLDVRSLPVPPYIAPYQQPNPFFATGNAFAPPRRLHVAAVFAF